MKHPHLFIAVFILILQVAAFADPATQPAGNVASIDQELVATSKEGFEYAQKLYASGVARLDEVCIWSDRLFEAETAVSADTTQRLNAARAYLERSQQLENDADMHFKAGLENKLGVLRTHYSRLKAENAIAELQAKP